MWQIFYILLEKKRPESCFFFQLTNWLIDYRFRYYTEEKKKRWLMITNTRVFRRNRRRKLKRERERERERESVTFTSRGLKFWWTVPWRAGEPERQQSAAARLQSGSVRRRSLCVNDDAGKPSTASHEPSRRFFCLSWIYNTPHRHLASPTERETCPRDVPASIFAVIRSMRRWPACRALRQVSVCANRLEKPLAYDKCQLVHNQ